MLTLEDCIAMSDLTAEEVDAIAEHEHLPATVATELGCYLVHLDDGRAAIRSMIRDDIDRAVAHRQFGHAAALRLVLRHFIDHCRENPALCR
jgi:hypothetical protein